MREAPVVSLDEHGILRIRYPESGHIDLPAIQSVLEQFRAMPHAPERVAVLVMNKSTLDASPEAEDYVMNAGVAAVTLAGASIVPSVGMAAAADHFYRLRPMPFPTKAFVREADAVAWLKTHMPHGYADSIKAGRANAASPSAMNVRHGVAVCAK